MFTFERIAVKQSNNDNQLTSVYSCVAAFLIWFRFSYVGLVHIMVSNFMVHSSAWLVHISAWFLDVYCGKPMVFVGTVR